MKITVQFTEVDENADPRPAGTLTFDGKSYSADKPDLMNVCRHPILIHTGEGFDEVDPIKDPVKFMESLHYKFRSFYFRASEATKS